LYRIAASIEAQPDKKFALFFEIKDIKNAREQSQMVMMKARLKQLFSYLQIILLLILISACAAPKHHILETEKDYQEAFNRVYFQGRAEMEVSVNYGRIDLLTGDYAIEVERIDKFHEGIGQALHYAKETGRKPGLAVFITDPTEHELEKLEYVRKLC
jgi:hypothetical protein